MNWLAANQKAFLNLFNFRFNLWKYIYAKLLFANKKTVDIWEKKLYKAGKSVIYVEKKWQ